MTNQEHQRAQPVPRQMDQPYVFFQLPRCPSCRGTNIITRSSRSNGDGTRLGYCQCRGCGARFKAVFE